MCLVLGAAQCFAIDGGPVYGGGQVTVTGTYAGSMVPIPTVLAPGVTVTDNSLVLFTFQVPKSGLASGTAAVFRNGFFYSGASGGLGGTTTGGSGGSQGIQASVDPDSGKITGILSTSFEEDITSGTTTQTAHFQADGQFVNAKVVSNTSSTSTALARIRGKASLTYILGANADLVPNSGAADSGGPIFYKIKGFKQSESTGLF